MLSEMDMIQQREGAYVIIRADVASPLFHPWALQFANQSVLEQMTEHQVALRCVLLAV